MVDSFESDMKQILLRYVLDHLEENEALGASYERADARRQSDTGDEVLAITEYLDMREAYDILNRHRLSLPADLADEIRAATVQLDRLVPIRNRVMHGRPLQPGDAEKATSACQSFTTRYWPSLRETLKRLAADSDWEPGLNGRVEAPPEKILHNLPMADFDDTGLVGRNQDCKKLVKYLIKRREPMVTVTGEGGIGKTSLALDVAYTLLDEPQSPYECILWTSLKVERLTAGGVVEIANAVRDITGAARQLGRVFDESFSGGVADLADALTGIETLLIIDNMETVTGAEIVSLYERLPDTVTYLLTSRIGVGEIERRYALQPLHVADAENLFRSFARTREQRHLASLSKGSLNEIILRLRYSPLAIRWYVLSVESGRQPLPTIHDQDALIEFCVRSVYEALTDIPRVILDTLYTLDRIATFDEIAVFTELAIDQLRGGVQSLIQGSLVTRKTDPDNELISRVQLTEAAQHFLKRIAPPARGFGERILAREQDLRRDGERRRQEEAKRKLDPNVVSVRTPNDEPTAHLLGLALAMSRAGDIRKAREFVEKARSLNPEFWEVDRVEAFILSQNNQVDEATSLYRSALKQADVQAVPIVSHHFAGHLLRKCYDSGLALQFATEAHEKLATSDTAQLLGNAHLRLGNYQIAQEYFEWSLDNLPRPGRLKLITMTSLITSWRRWSESLLDEQRHPAEAADKAYTGFSTGIKELDYGVADLKMAGATLECAKLFLRAVTESSSFPLDRSQMTARILDGVRRNSEIFERCAAWRHFPGRVGKLHRISGVPSNIRRTCEELVNISTPRTLDDGSAPGLRGVISSWRGTFGFISHPDYLQGVFFPASVVVELTGTPGDSVDLKGYRVDFEVDEYGKGDRPRAGIVSLTESPPDSGQACIGRQAPVL